MNFDFPLLVLVTLAALAVAVWGLLQPDGMLRYPFLASTVYLGWFLPQAIGLSEEAWLPVGGYSILMFMALLCLLGIYSADKVRLRPGRAQLWEYDERKLLLGSVGLTAFGTFFAFMISSLPPEMLSGAWTGVATIYLFMAKAQYFGFAVAFLLLLRSFSKLALLVAMFNMYFFLFAIFIGGRRGVALEISLIILTALWFERRIMLPRLMIIALAVIGSLLFNSIGQYRSLTYRGSKLGYGAGEWSIPSINEIRSIDYIGTLESFAATGSNEVSNAIYYISAVNNSSDFNFGGTYWNDLLFRYVPGQLLGIDFKQSLMLQLYDSTSPIFAYERQIGTTYTGFFDSFSAFWYFGAFSFFLIGIIMRRLYERAMMDDFHGKLFYGLLIAVAMHAVTHSTSWFFVYLPQVFLFVLPVLWMARRRPIPGGGLLHRDQRRVPLDREPGRGKVPPRFRP